MRCRAHSDAAGLYECGAEAALPIPLCCGLFKAALLTWGKCLVSASHWKSLMRIRKKDSVQRGGGVMAQGHSKAESLTALVWLHCRWALCKCITLKTTLAKEAKKTSRKACISFSSTSALLQSRHEASSLCCPVSQKHIPVFSYTSLITALKSLLAPY